MSLTTERRNEIAFGTLMLKYHENGVALNPSKTREEVTIMAKKLGLSTWEMAEAAEILYTNLFNQVTEILHVMQKEKKDAKSDAS